MDSLLAQVETLTGVQQRAIGAVLGAFVADAAGKLVT